MCVCLATGAFPCERSAQCHHVSANALQDASDARKRKESDSFSITRRTTVSTDFDDDGGPVARSGLEDMRIRLSNSETDELIVTALHPLDFALWTDSLQKVVESKKEAFEAAARKANPSLMF